MKELKNEYATSSHYTRSSHHKHAKGGNAGDADKGGDKKTRKIITSYEEIKKRTRFDSMQNEVITDDHQKEATPFAI